MSPTLPSATRSKINLVAIGGGTGLATLLSGLKRYVGRDEEPSVGDLAAVVAVTDDGGSSGRLRDELQMLPPGDIRNCMVALSEDSNLLSKLFRHRFAGSGELAGHNFGNLFLAALSEITGDFAEAVRLSSEVLASKGHIYPATVADVRLAAELKDGSTVLGETAISKVGNSIDRLYLTPEDCQPLQETLSAIRDADVITVGPGSLLTSLLPPLLVKGIADAMEHAPATKIFIANLMTQPGETDGMTLKEHLETLRRYAPSIDFDCILLNDRRISNEQTEAYAREGAEQIGLRGSIEKGPIEGASLVYTDLLEEDEKVRHDPDKLARAVLRCDRPATPVL